jgi:uridine kinase
MKRAIDRNVERLDKTTLAHDYNTYYYPAQHYHFGKDQPRSRADIVYCNDELSGTVGHMTVTF